MQEHWFLTGTLRTPQKCTGKHILLQMYPSLTCQKATRESQRWFQNHPNHQGQNPSQSPPKCQVPSPASQAEAQAGGESPGENSICPETGRYDRWMNCPRDAPCASSRGARSPGNRAEPDSSFTWLHRLENFTLCSLF